MLTIINIFINDHFFAKNNRFSKKQSNKKRLLIVFIKTTVFKTDLYLFSKSSKRVGRFYRRSFFFRKLLLLKTIEKRNKKRSFSKTINNPTYEYNYIWSVDIHFRFVFNSSFFPLPLKIYVFCRSLTDSSVNFQTLPFR